jgi:hypothetical protein
VAGLECHFCYTPEAGIALESECPNYHEDHGDFEYADGYHSVGYHYGSA